MAAPNPYAMPNIGQFPPMFAPGPAPGPYGYQRGNVNPALQGQDPQMPMVNGGPPGSPWGFAGGGMYDGNPQAGAGTTGGMDWGYGNRAGGTTGYYEQQTPLGSAAAANQQNAINPYIGQQSQQIAGVGPIGGNAGQNPYLGGSSGQAAAGQNQFYGANNPYTTQAIDNASQDAIRNYQTFTAPKREAAMVRSGSFGNTGQQQMQLEEERNLGRELGSIATNARMQDLFRQQDMGEGAANRQTGVSQFNVGANANDLTRNLLGTFQGQGMGLDAAKFNAGNTIDMQKFNAALNSGDLSRNAGLAQQLGMFNAGQGNATNMFNAGQLNNMLHQQRGLGEQGRQFDATRADGTDRFNQGMDFQTWQANNANMRGGNQDTMNFMDMLMRWQGQGVASENQQQQNPYQQWLQMIQGAGTAGGMGGSNTTPYYSDPFLGAWAGWNAMNRNGG